MPADHPATAATAHAPLNADACYRALQTHDARFDGRLYVGVTSTGIYCRPVCRVRIPRPENCRYFELAAQAEKAGYRPCLRCRPELAPRALAWSHHDAGPTLAQQALNLLQTGSDANGQPLGPERVAERLGVSTRHLRRLLETQLGVSPLQVLQTRRLLCAKQLLCDTHLPVADVATLAGFGSTRRFHAAFAAHYGLTPARLRAGTTQATAPATSKAGTTDARLRSAGSHTAEPDAITLRLTYRPPYDLAALLAFLSPRALTGVEHIPAAPDADGTAELRRTVPHGWIATRFVPAEQQLMLRVSAGLTHALPRLAQQVRDWLDLDADPEAIHAVLGGDFPHAAGQRLPGTLDGFELAVRAVLGQQITVAAARTLAQRLTDCLGEPCTTPWPQLHRRFPTPAVLAQVAPETLGALGIVRQRQTALIALARAVDSGQLRLDCNADMARTQSALLALPGFGPWTVQYIAMRALRWPDAFVAGDVALHRALQLDPALPTAQRARLAEARAQAWRPWRSYAVLRAWQLGSENKPNCNSFDSNKSLSDMPKQGF